MLKELTLNSTVYLVTGYSDLRKGIEGLAAVVQGTLSLDPFNKSLYLFCGRRRDRIKGLLWEGDGFLLLYKRLDSGVFRWPRNETEARLLSEQEIDDFQYTKKYCFWIWKKPGIATWLFYICFHFSVIFFYVYICETYATLDTTKG